MLYIEDNKLVLREENVAIPDHFATVLHGRAEKMYKSGRFRCAEAVVRAFIDVTDQKQLRRYCAQQYMKQNISRDKLRSEQRIEEQYGYERPAYSAQADISRQPGVAEKKRRGGDYGHSYTVRQQETFPSERRTVADALHRQQIVAERAGGEKKLRIGGAYRRRNYADKQQHRGERREKLPQCSESERLFNISYKRMLRSARHDEERDAQVNPADYIWSYGEQAKSLFFAAAGDYPYRVLGIAGDAEPPRQHYHRA